MIRLFPPNSVRENLPFEKIYTYPELNFPTEGIPFGHNELRPYIYFNMVSSADGKATSVSEDAAGIGSRSDFELMGRLRMAADAVLVGAGTFRRDPFLPDTRQNLVAERKLYFPNSPHPLGVTLSRNGNIPIDKRFFEGDPARRIIFLGKDTPADKAENLRKYAQVYLLEKSEEGQINLGLVLSILHQKFSVRRLLCEGGPTLNYQMLSRGFGDELFWTIAPKIIGGSENQTTVEGEGRGWRPEDVKKLSLISMYENSSEMFMRYKIVH